MTRESKGQQLARPAANHGGEAVAAARHGGMRAVGVTAGRVAAPILARHGGGLAARLKAHWSAVVGEEFAAIAWPESLARGGALKLRVATGFGLEIQHRAPLLVERINRFFGHATVVRLVLVQGSLPSALLPAPVPPPLSASEQRSLSERLAGVSDPDLRAALAGLGRVVAAATRNPGQDDG